MTQPFPILVVFQMNSNQQPQRQSLYNKLSNIIYNVTKKCISWLHSVFYSPSHTERIYGRVLQSPILFMQNINFIPDPTLIYSSQVHTCKNCIEDIHYSKPMECEICYDKTSSLLELHPCHHYCCVVCIKKLESPDCPFCKQRIYLHTRGPRSSSSDMEEFLYQSCSMYLFHRHKGIYLFKK
jgi:hypothetical protein